MVWTAGAFCKNEIEVIMSLKKTWYLITYDVREAKRLQKVGKLMTGYGTRIQYSVFQCRLNNRLLERLRWELAKLMKKEDDLLIIELCKSCVKRLRKRCGNNVWPEEPPTFEII